MSWNPFKHGPKKSAISKTAEREFERELKKLEQLDENTKKVHKDMKRCMEEQTAQAKSAVKASQDLVNSAICREDDKLKQAAEAWLHSNQRLETATQELNANCNKVVVEPMKKLTTVFPHIQNDIKKREQSLQEYTRCQTKVEKYQERGRTGPVLVKLDTNKKALAKAREEYDTLNTPLMEDMPKLYEGRIDYFQPSLQALIKSQVKYYTDSHNVYNELSQKLQHGSHDGPKTGEEIKSSIQQKLAEIKALSITADD